MRDCRGEWRVARKAARKPEESRGAGERPRTEDPGRRRSFINHLLINSADRAENAAMIPARSPATDADLRRALDASLPFGPSYAGATGLKLASHLPMALTALHRLGAPAAALERHIGRWRPRLVPEAAAAGPAPAAAPAYGAPYAEWLRHLEAGAAGADVHALLREHLPALLAAPESGAFHGAIRLAYACDSGHAGEFQRALAAWCASFRSLGALPAFPADAPTTLEALRATLDAVRADPAMAMTPRRNTTIFSDMRVAVELPAFAAHLARVRPGLDALAEAALATWLATRDFTALHLVTGLHAARTLLARVPPDDAARPAALQPLWRAWLAAWVSIGRPAPDWAAVHAGSAHEADWAAALPAVAASPDDHVIKLADAAREEWRHRGWPGYARCLPAVGAGAGVPAATP
jgi:hypothetical protein